MEEYGVRKAERHRGLAIASVVLGAVSCFCCLGSGIGVIPAVIAIVFAIITIAGGGTVLRRIGWLGLVTGLIGLILNIVFIAIAISVINWDMLTFDRLATIQNIDPDNETEVLNWMQQFLKIDLSKAQLWLH